MITFLRNWSTTLWAQWVASVGHTVPSSAPPPEDQQPHRGQLISRLSALQAEHAAATAARNQQILALERAFQDAQIRARELASELEGLYDHRMAESLCIGAAEDDLRNQLVACCPLAVETFLEQVNQEIAYWRQAQNPETSGLSRLSALMRAREQAEALRCAPVPAADILTDLRRLEAGLPKVAPELRRGHMVAPSQGGRTWN